MRSAPKRFVISKKISKKDDRFLSKKEAQRKARICLEEQKQIMSQELLGKKFYTDTADEEDQEPIVISDVRSLADELDVNTFLVDDNNLSKFFWMRKIRSLNLLSTKRMYRTSLNLLSSKRMHWM